MRTRMFQMRRKKGKQLWTVCLRVVGWPSGERRSGHLLRFRPLQFQHPGLPSSSSPCGVPCSNPCGVQCSHSRCSCCRCCSSRGCCAGSCRSSWSGYSCRHGPLSPLLRLPPPLLRRRQPLPPLTTLPLLAPHSQPPLPTQTPQHPLPIPRRWQITFCSVFFPITGAGNDTYKQISAQTAPTF